MSIDIICSIFDGNQVFNFGWQCLRVDAPTLSFLPARSGILILPFILLHQRQQFFKLFHPIRLQFSSSIDFPIVLNPIEIQPTLFIIMLRRIPLIVLNEHNHLIVFQQPLLVLGHTSDYIMTRLFSLSRFFLKHLVHKRIRLFLQLSGLNGHLDVFLRALYGSIQFPFCTQVSYPGGVL